ncbi:MAG: hypothetical protein HY300_10720 [Verrucomicrobia bacterium]|nr:hypothetical protein [Verrucomicrobiota bacterium]
MNLLNTMIFILMAASSLLAGCATTPPPDAWEYRDEFLTEKVSLNDLAKDGWIVVNAYYDAENKSTHFLIKRLKKNK